MKITDRLPKEKLIRFGDKAVNAVVGGISKLMPDKYIPTLNRYDNHGYLEGSGYFMPAPDKNAFWSVGYASASVVPQERHGDYYIGGYLAYPANKMTGVINEQMIRVFAFDDNSDRGINIFAVIDCVGISNVDIRDIRNRLSKDITEKNIASINISATHCHSGIDTVGLWGDIIASTKNNVKALAKFKTKDTVSGKNKEFMEYLKDTAAQTVRDAIADMKKGKLAYAKIPMDDFIRDKRPPYVFDNMLTALKFTPEDGSKPCVGVFMGAHPTCYGDKQTEAICDFPWFICDELTNNGLNAAFFQGAELAIAADRGKRIPDLPRNESIEAYGRTIAKCVLETDSSEYTEIKPLLNVAVRELFLPADNKILELACKVKLANNNLAKIIMSDDKNGKDYELCIPTEIGFAQFGEDMYFAMVPGELAPELAIGGTFSAAKSYNGKDWQYPPLTDILGKNLTVIGLCNDFIGYIIPDNDFGSIFAPLHYEESVSAGRRTASNIISAFIRLKAHTKTITYNKDT